ncbi:tetratricopeptide repeat protein [candidate division CSSED10-310 bacterium]|uniref:Tetratricopeptide repeat protein n=1 Tax=candidate division CSSED10-310 bacterium TaxID=2855610 RepID=A0ABV6YS89_UNCC1
MKGYRTLILGLIIFCLLFAFYLTPVTAGTRGKLRGSVTGSDGKPIPDVDITVQSLRVANEEYKFKSKEDGTFMYMGMKPYKYKISFEKKGYQTYIEPEFKMRIDIWVELHVKMFTFDELRAKAIDDMPPEQKANLLFNQAVDLYETGDIDGTIEKLKGSIENNPDLLKAYELLGMIYYTKKKDMAQSKTTFEGAIAIDADSVVSYEILGAIAHQNGDEPKATEYWQKYFELGGDNGVVAENLAVLFLKKNDNENARKYLEKGIAGESEDYAPLYRRLGDVCMRQNDFEAAVKYYNKYLELKPDASDKALVMNFIKALEKAVQKTKEKK